MNIKPSDIKQRKREENKEGRRKKSNTQIELKYGEKEKSHYPNSSGHSFFNEASHDNNESTKANKSYSKK